MPSTPTNTYQFSQLTPSRHPELALQERWQMTASLTFTLGETLAVTTSTGKLVAYVNGQPDGVGTPVGFCPFACVSDGTGAITVEGGNIWGTTEDTIPVWIGGYFSSADLSGLDATALTALGGHLVRGDLSTGEIVVPV